MDKWVTARVMAVTHLPTAPTTTTAAVARLRSEHLGCTLVARPHDGQDGPTQDEVGSFSMMTAAPSDR